MPSKGADLSDLLLQKGGAREITEFTSAWVPWFLQKKFTDSNWNYRLFEWDEILENDFYQNVAAVDPRGLLHGLMAFRLRSDHVRVDFVATAPFNFGRAGARKGVGSALLSHAVQLSIANGHKGKLLLASTPESESYYETHMFRRTGKQDDEGLPFFELPAGRPAEVFTATFPPIVSTSK